MCKQLTMFAQNRAPRFLKWYLIFNPFGCLKLLLLAICILAGGYLLAINVLIVEIGEANGSKHKIADDPDHVYSTPLRHGHQ
jgi:hypothetical protein